MQRGARQSQLSIGIASSPDKKPSAPRNFICLDDPSIFMHIVHFIQAHQLQNYIYFALFCGMFIDAALTVFAAVFLMADKIIGIAPGLLVLLLGIFAEQLGFYWLGMKLSKREWLAKWANKVAAPFDRHLLARPFHTLLISKFIYGLHHGLLIRSGMIRLPFKKFMKDSAYIGVIWLAIIGSLGFIFSASYHQFKNYLRFAEVIPLIFIGLYFFAKWLVSKRLKKEI